MAKIAGGQLTKAVSIAGGLGVLGGGYGDPAWISDQMAIVGDTPAAIGLITWHMQAGAVTSALEHQPKAIWLSFGDPVPYIAEIHEAGALAICQVGTVDEAVAAANAGADLLVAQGSEAGGHGRTGRALFGLIPAIARALPSVPLVAAGGITDQRGADAALALGACGVAVGTALYATHEANDVDAAKQRLIDARGDDTVQSRVYDLVRGPEWPEGYTGRSIKTELTDKWAGQESTLRLDLEPVIERHAQAVADSDMSIRVVWAGEGLDSITVVEAAADVIGRFSAP